MRKSFRAYGGTSNQHTVARLRACKLVVMTSHHVVLQRRAPVIRVLLLLPCPCYSILPPSRARQAPCGVLAKSPKLRQLTRRGVTLFSEHPVRFLRTWVGSVCYSAMPKEAWHDNETTATP